MHSWCSISPTVHHWKEFAESVPQMGHRHPSLQSPALKIMIHSTTLIAISNIEHHLQSIRCTTKKKCSSIWSSEQDWIIYDRSKSERVSKLSYADTIPHLKTCTNSENVIWLSHITILCVTLIVTGFWDSSQTAGFEYELAQCYTLTRMQSMCNSLLVQHLAFSFANDGKNSFSGLEPTTY